MDQLNVGMPQKIAKPSIMHIFFDLIFELLQMMQWVISRLL